VYAGVAASTAAGVLAPNDNTEKSRHADAYVAWETLVCALLFAPVRVDGVFC